MFDIKKVMEEANKEIAEERSKKAKFALITALRKLEASKQVTRNIEAEIKDLQASIEDGSFAG